MTSRTTTTRTTITTTVTTNTIPSSPDTQAALIKAEQQDPNSAASKLCRQTHWVTGGLPRNAPATAEIFYKRVSERKKVYKAELEWKRRKQQALEKQEARWGSSGLMGLVDNTMPRGRALMQWHEELFKESRSNGDRAGPSG